MTADGKWAGFSKGQLFSERTQFLEIFSLESEFRFQPVRVKGRKFGRITTFHQRKRREQTLAKRSS
jgi:hypothetical protein